MTGYNFYRFYLSLHLHFTSDTYNVFEHRGQVKAAVSTFEARRDKMLFERLAKKFETEREAVRFLVANFAHRNFKMIWDDYDIAFDNQTKWIKVKESITKVFADDLQYMQGLIDRDKIDYDRLINCTDNQVSGIIKLLKSGMIHVETVCLIHQLNPGLLDSWNKVVTLQKLYHDDFLLVMKLSPFVKSNDSIQAEWEGFSSSLKKE